MKNITFHNSFTPTDAKGSVTYDNVFTFGAGVQWFEAYEAGQQHNRLLVGANSLRGSVGAAGGWLQGGGHSLISPNYGLGVDNVLEITIVTADGNHVIANPYRNQDLFWALRGGGGGTWGVVTSVTYKTHPSTPFASVLLVFNSTNTNSTRNLLTEIIRLTPSLVEQGYGGFSIWPKSDTHLFIVLSPNVTAEQNEATFNPLFEFAHSQPGLSVQVNRTLLYQNWWEFYNDTFSEDGQVGVPLEISSWLLPKDVVEKPEMVAAELLKTSGFSYYLVTGGQVSRADPESMGLNPVWRNSVAYTTVGMSWQDGANETVINAARQVAIQDMKIIESMAPNSGAYLNEASRYEFDWKKSFFGTHYNKLRAIKQKYDPRSLFLVYEGIASDEWDTDLVCQV